MGVLSRLTPCAFCIGFAALKRARVVSKSAAELPTTIFQLGAGRQGHPLSLSLSELPLFLFRMYYALLQFVKPNADRLSQKSSLIMLFTKSLLTILAASVVCASAAPLKASPRTSLFRNPKYLHPISPTPKLQLRARRHRLPSSPSRYPFIS